MDTPKNPHLKLLGYVAAEHGINGWFCVFDRSEQDASWHDGGPKHQWLVKFMPSGPAQTARTKDAALDLAKLSASTTIDQIAWWRLAAQ
jgi:ribosomal 30S subunit maturation factor RimM